MKRWACVAAFLESVGSSGAADLIREHMVDERVWPDEALVNVRVAFNRWPDCTTLESAVADIFRIEGVQKASDEARALALWKWFRILVSATGGGYVFEHGGHLRGGLVTDPHKILATYGHHMCDGQSWAMAALWRAAGYLAFDQCHHGHTITSLYYRDADGQHRFHDFDPQGRFYYWDAANGRVGTWTNPLLRGKVHRHLMLPVRVQSLRTSLRVGESVERRWENRGHIVPSGRDREKALQAEYYAYVPGRKDGIYAVAGEQVQTLVADTSERFVWQQAVAPVNVVSVGGRLQPEEAGEPASLVYRLGPPYVIADATVKATLVKASAGDTCRILFSRDGEDWEPVHEVTDAGEASVSLDLGLAALRKRKPSAYTDYSLYVKVEMRAAGDAKKPGLAALRIATRRMLNKRVLPTLRPGPNTVCVTADKCMHPFALRLRVRYRVDGKQRTAEAIIARFPYTFRIDVPAGPEKVLKNYDKDWNSGSVQMDAICMQLVKARPGAWRSRSLPETEARKAFSISDPHPADMTNRKMVKKPETDVRQSNGFFPQGPQGTRKADDRMKELVRLLNKGRLVRGKAVYRQWTAAEDLGEYPEALDPLLEALPRANLDLAVFICKALSRIPSKKAIPVLLEKWELAPGQAPGTRYIPDVLAAIGDRSVVPALVEKLPRCRFDFRIHIARALGLLGGAEAVTALRDLADNDPLRAVREEARRHLPNP